MRASWMLGRWRGIPISIHWSIFLGILWFLYDEGDVPGAALAFAAFVFLLLAHELGHAAVATWRRVEVLEVRLYLLHGYCAHEAPRYEIDDAAIAWGGVAAQLVVLVVGVAADLLLATSSYRYDAASPVLGVFIEMNLVLMIVNLIPVTPLDGATAWRIFPISAEAARTKWARSRRRRSARRENARNAQADVESERVVVDISDKLKKRKSDG